MNENKIPIETQQVLKDFVIRYRYLENGQWRARYDVKIRRDCSPLIFIFGDGTTIGESLYELVIKVQSLVRALTILQSVHSYLDVEMTIMSVEQESLLQFLTAFIDVTCNRQPIGGESNGD